MKPTFMDKLVGFFSPSAGLRRIQMRIGAEAALRAYDSAQTYGTSEWTSATKAGSNAEIKAAQAILRTKARDLARNNPYGVRALNVIVSNTVGAGIVPNIRGKTSQTKKLNELWRQWAESTACDIEGRQNFYSLQAMVMRSVVESGEGLALKKFTKLGPKVQILESDFIASDKDEGKIVQGVEYDSNGMRTKIHLYKSHPGERDPNSETISVPVSDVAHVFKAERPGQVRGISWAHAIIEKIKDFDDYQSATLIRQKVAACFGGFITSNPNDSLLGAESLKAKREAEFSMTPATFRYLAPGEDVKLSSPPGVDGYSDFSRETLRAIAAGYGISYEALTGDYSQVNFSSGRMGNIEMRRNIEHWRWNMLIPQFCDPVFAWFLQWAELQGVRTEGVTVDWVPPAHAMIDPKSEIAALKEEVRNGFKSYGEAIQEQGRDPDQTLLSIAGWNKKIDDLKIALDTDPRRMSTIGFAQAGEALSKLSEADYLQDKQESNEGNPSGTEDEANASEESDSSGAE